MHTQRCTSVVESSMELPRCKADSGTSSPPTTKEDCHSNPPPGWQVIRPPTEQYCPLKVRDV